MGYGQGTHGFPWGRFAAVLLVLAGAAYAAQRPHSFVYYLVKFILLPIP